MVVKRSAPAAALFGCRSDGQDYAAPARAVALVSPALLGAYARNMADWGCPRATLPLPLAA